MSGTIVVPDIALHELVELVKGGECILFLGAGIHCAPPSESAYKYPEESRPLLGGELAERLAAQCDYCGQLPMESSRDLQRVSLCYQYTKGLDRTKLVSDLDKYLMEGKEPSPLLEMLASLPFRLVVTTNYDRLTEMAFNHQKKDPKVVVYSPNSDQPTEDSAQDPTAKRPLIFKMHGDLQKENSIVITDEDYITFVQRMSEGKEQFHPVPSTIRFRMVRWRTLFLGYSLRDYNLRLLFRTLRWRLDQSNFPSSFSIDHHPDPLILQVWQNERRFITFVPQDLWSFVPWLYKQVQGKDYSDD